VKVRVVLAALLLAATGAGAQEWWRGGYQVGAPRFPTEQSFDGTFNFCRAMYPSGRAEDGGSGWSTDYPDADINFSIRLAELTKTRVSKEPAGNPNHLVVRLSDELLVRCPFLIMEDAGTAALSDADVRALRTYLLKGGFLWIDDFWGTRAWDSWVRELSRVLPPADYPVQDLTPEHPVFRTVYTVAAVPQIPSIQFWRRSGGRTSERGRDSAEPHMRGVSDARGRLMVLMTHNTDIADAWEREGEDPTFFYTFSPDGYAVGINTLMYAMTH
jgi:hypothetical protein